MEPKRKIVKMLLTLVLCASSACAEIITFEVSGTMTDGAVLSGTMTIDNVAGIVTEANFQFGAPNSETFSVVEYDAVVGGARIVLLQRHRKGRSWLLQTIPTGASLGSLPDFNLFLPTDTLVGYEGGSLCSVSALCSIGGASSVVSLGGATVFLHSGSAAAVPEPSTSTLLAIGLVGLLAGGWWRRRELLT